MIVKIQRPLFSNKVPDGMKTALIYDESRDFMHMLPMTGTVLELLGDQDKVYAECEVERGRLVFGKRVEPQDW